MFTFHKSESLPRSRQSSIDSQVLDSSMSQYSDSLFQNDMHSPERRRRAYPGKRSSVFNLRSRSNTANSSTSLTLSGTAEHGSWPHDSSSTTQFAEHHGQEDSTGTARSIFRGKIGKRVSGSVTSSADMEEDQEGDGGKKRMSVLRRGRRRTNQSEFGPNGLKHRISSPFDFQHLSHTDRHQIAALDEAFGDELAAGFHAGRHSSNQDLLATMAGSRPSGSLTPTHVTSSYFRSTSPLGSFSPSQSPNLSNEWQEPEYTQQDLSARPSLRMTRSVESFSQPGVPPRNHRHSQSVVAPARRSSLQPLASIDDVPEESADKQSPTPISRSRSKRESGVWDLFDLSAVAAVAAIEAEPSAESMFVGQALTTADDSALSTVTPPFSPSLEDVAEEPERFVSPRPAPQPPLRTPTTPKSPFLDSFSFGGPRSPISRYRSRGNSHTSPKSTNYRGTMAQSIEKALPSLPVTYGRTSQTPFASHRKSNTWRAIEESWENDVDFIYDNALEAESEFDWGYSPEDEYHDSQQGYTQHVHDDEDYSTASQHARAPSSVLGNHQMYRIRPDRSNNSVSGAPRSHTASAVSASMADRGLHISTNSRKVSDGFALSPSLLLPREYKDTQETMYQYEDVENLLDEYENLDHQVPITDADDSGFDSARSSRVRSSRRSSYDSSLISSTHGSGLWNSPVRRSASSAGSIPELVHSRRTRREFTTMVDELSEQVATLGLFRKDTDDNDITPPGFTGEGRTFFTSEDDSHEDYRTITCADKDVKTSFDFARRDSQHCVSVENEVKNSLELARKGSQRSKHTLHKQALSSGAAEEVLATAERRSTKSRSRAATTSYPTRQPQLSLFPSPPRHIPNNRV